MVSSSSLNQVLCLVGPTASGKSGLAIEIAKKFNGEIINADSRQIYKELGIGTAKPSSEDLARIPHHLIDCASLKDPWDVQRFISAARQSVFDISFRGKLPILVGGTGMYIKYFLFGLAEIPKIDDKIREQLKSQLNEKGLSFLYDQLQKLDSDSAQEIKSGDTQRILRALEVYCQTGRSIREYWNSNQKPLYSYLKLALKWPREILYQRINERVLVMIHQGLKEEAKALFAKHKDNSVLEKTIGYAEWKKYGFDNDEVVIQKIQQNSRHFAKRQLTWFQNENDVEWMRPDDNSIFQRVEEFLGKNL